jgi:hypothetical protein
MWLRAVRERPPYWSRAELARLLRAAADPRARARLPRVTSLTHMIKEWEAAKHAISPRYRNLYTAVLADTYDRSRARSPHEPGDDEKVNLRGVLRNVLQDGQLDEPVYLWAYDADGRLARYQVTGFFVDSDGEQQFLVDDGTGRAPRKPPPPHM